MKASEDYMSNMFGQYTPAKYLANKVKNDPPRRLKNLINRVTGGGKADESVTMECGKDGCITKANNSSNKPRPQMSKTAIRSKKSNFHKRKHKLNIVHKGDA